MLTMHLGAACAPRCACPARNDAVSRPDECLVHCEKPSVLSPDMLKASRDARQEEAVPLAMKLSLSHDSLSVPCHLS